MEGQSAPKQRLLTGAILVAVVGFATMLYGLVASGAPETKLILAIVGAALFLASVVLAVAQVLREAMADLDRTLRASIPASAPSKPREKPASPDEPPPPMGQVSAQAGSVVPLRARPRR